jgi:phytoene dehydrogenase-like protein
MKYGRMNCDEYFRKQGFTNETLKYFFNAIYGSRDFSALAFIMMFAWFNQKNAGYLIGGSLPMAKRMTNRYLDLGGKLTKKARVSKIIVENNVAKGVILSDGSEISADYVISAADGHSTIYDMLEGKYLTDKISNAYKNWQLFTPIVQVSFGINKVIDSETPVETWIIKDQMIGRTRTTQGYSLMNYCFDSTMAPEGKSVIVMRYESPWELWKDIEPAEYKIEKEQIEKDAKAILEKRYPGISANIEVCDVATPVTDVNYTGVWKGSYEGFLPSSKNLMDNISPVIPGLKKFYMAGQWLFPGGGLPPAGQSGKWAIQYICKEEGIGFNSKLEAVSKV